MIYSNATSAFESLYGRIMSDGELFADTKALFNESFSLLNPKERIIMTPQRKFSQDYAEFEWNWYLSGDRDAAEISERAKMWKKMMVPGTSSVVSNYGHFWNYNDQLKRAINEIKANPETRRAIVVHYLLHELDLYKYDTPCNLALNFYVRSGQLDLTVMARSIDIWFGFGCDQYCFSKLMYMVSEQTGHPVGQMHWHVTNLHLYPRFWGRL
jgi:thymidylate synthase